MQYYFWIVTHTTFNKSSSTSFAVEYASYGRDKRAKLHLYDTNVYVGTDKTYINNIKNLVLEEVGYIVFDKLRVFADATTWRIVNLLLDELLPLSIFVNAVDALVEIKDSTLPLTNLYTKNFKSFGLIMQRELRERSKMLLELLNFECRTRLYHDNVCNDILQVQKESEVTTMVYRIGEDHQRIISPKIIEVLQEQSVMLKLEVPIRTYDSKLKELKVFQFCFYENPIDVRIKLSYCWRREISVLMSATKSFKTKTTWSVELTKKGIDLFKILIQSGIRFRLLNRDYYISEWQVVSRWNAAYLYKDLDFSLPSNELRRFRVIDASKNFIACKIFRRFGVVEWKDPTFCGFIM